jgi:hypothetical protein
MGVLGGVAASKGAFDFAQIIRERGSLAATPVAGWFFVKKIVLGHDDFFRRQAANAMSFSRLGMGGLYWKNRRPARRISTGANGVVAVGSTAGG